MANHFTSEQQHALTNDLGGTSKTQPGFFHNDSHLCEYVSDASSLAECFIEIEENATL